jgi:hypothetical protein
MDTSYNNLLLAFEEADLQKMKALIRLVLSGIKKVIWAANDEEYGAIRRMKEGPHFVEQFSTITYVAAPYLELENRQRKMLADWNINRGFKETSWQYPIQQAKTMLK